MTYRCCSKCKEAKSLDSFGKDKNKEDGLAVRCRECRKEDQAYYYKNNKETCLRATKKWIKDNKEKHKETTSLYYLQNRERIIERTLKHQKNNRATYNKYAAEYRAKKLKATPKWSNDSLVQTKYWYAQWLSETVGIPYEVDHIVPLQNKTICGLHTEDNLQVILMTENRRKSNSFKGEGLSLTVK